MRIDRFKFLLKREYDVFYLRENIIITKKPYAITDLNTDETIVFSTVEDLLEHVIDSIKVCEMILKLEAPFTPVLSGGRGAGSGSENVQTWRDAGGGSGRTKDILPARANVKIQSKSLEGALAEFKRNHLLADKEFAYEVDSDGYVHQYRAGGSSAVEIGSYARVRKGERTMIIHNHPNASAFSPSDMLSTAADRRSKGIIASGKSYDYIFEKGSHFDAAGFTKAVNRATKQGIKGKDINEAVDKFLRKNADKYGYKYRRVKN